ncbi:MAG: hypothetical protein K2X86_18240 [Cytophagaceae bacterium]|nr:hypothetical protein [Cytophagaceae bacterium]
MYFFKIYIHSFFPLLLIITIVSTSDAQNLESIGKEKPLKVSGSLGTTHTFYGVNGIENRRPPYLWFLNGGINFDLYGWSVPFSASWSNQNREFRQPFNQYGVSPNYRWITAHFGYRNLTFSPYTLAGHTFLGAGVELTPGIWRISAMYGRLNKAIAEDTLSPNADLPSFKRMGYGLKVGLNKDGSFIDLIFFTAKDDITSIPYVPLQNNVLPAQNMVVSVNAQKQLGKRTVFGFEYATSAYTRDIRATNAEQENKNVFSPFYTHKNSTQYYSAFKSNLTYNGDFYSLALGYERIEPEYRTLGAYFFNNDLENITIAPSIRMFKQRLNLNVNAGIQRNNILENNTSTTRRYIGSVNCSYVPNQKWNFAAQYSNFITYNRLSRKFDQFQSLDTLNFYQVTESGNFNTGYNSTGKEIRHGVNLNLAYQKANQTQGEQVTSNESVFYNGNLVYRYSILPKTLTILAGVNGNQNQIGEISSLAFGPTASISKSFFDKKMRASLTTTYNNILTDQELTGSAINVVVSSGYTFEKRNNFSLNLMVLNKNSKASSSSNFTEYNTPLKLNH